MGTANLHQMFNPKSIAVIGASDKKGTVGYALMNNIISNGFSGQVIPVNPTHKTIMGKNALPAVENIENPVDLAIVATPIQTTPEIVKSCGRAGIGGAVIISSGGKEIGEKGRLLEARIRDAAQLHNLRVIGPNCLGFVNMSKALNASFAHQAPLSGNIAFLSQSGAVCTSVLDLANREKIGFSHVVSLGSMMDVDFADMIDYFGGLMQVKSIVMYMENITNIRNFMSAARSVSRVKPIIALKTGRSETGAKAAASHTGALVGDDAVYDAAFNRAGILRADTFEELLEYSHFLAKAGRPAGPGLTIITNAGGPGVMAADALESCGIIPAPLEEQTREELNRILPENWSRGNPVDILGDADTDRYIKTVKICGNAASTDALLLLCSPAGIMDTAQLAKALLPCLKLMKCPVFTAWIGGDNVQKARRIFNQAGIATYDSPERAVRAYKSLYQYQKNIETLMEIPVRKDKKLIIDRPGARKVIDMAMAEGRKNLTEIEAKQVLSFYGIPVNLTYPAWSKTRAKEISKEIGFPVALKICSSDVLHKSDSGGVMLNLKTQREVTAGFEVIKQRAEKYFPHPDNFCVSIQHCLTNADYELIIGSKTDPQFGPVILFGMGGVMTEIVNDTALGLPPLNRLLASEMITRTKVSGLIDGYRNIKPADRALIEEMLIRISRMVTDFPQIEELDINPVLIKDGLPTAVDARMILKKTSLKEADHLIISAYPWKYERWASTTDGRRIFIRPIRPSDADLLIDHFYSLSPRSVYMRFFSPIKQLSKMTLVKLTQIDYDREIALVALYEHGGEKKIKGICRIILEPDKTLGEFAMAISDPWQGKGVGSALLKQCLAAAKEKGVKKVMGIVLAENRQMLQLARKIGFTINNIHQCGEYELHIDCEKVPFN